MTTDVAAEASTVRLHSADFLYAPGWLHALRAEARFDPERARKLFCATWPQAPAAAVELALAGRYVVDDETVCITLPAEETPS